MVLGKEFCPFQGAGLFFSVIKKRGRVWWVKYVAEFNGACCGTHHNFPARA